MAVTYQQVNEKSTTWIDVIFTDLDGAAAAPSTLEYCLDCMSSGTLILDWTNVSTPTSTTRITITPTQGAIHDSTKTSELHRLTVHATFGVSDEIRDEYKFEVMNLGKVT